MARSVVVLEVPFRDADPAQFVTNLVYRDKAVSDALARNEAPLKPKLPNLAKTLAPGCSSGERTFRAAGCALVPRVKV